jgi:hypothetical protein
MQFDHLEASGQRATSSGGEILAHFGNTGTVERRWHEPAFGNRLGTGGNHGPGMIATGRIDLVERAVAEIRALHRSLGAGMRNLDTGRSALCLYETGNAGQPFDMTVFPDANIAVGNARLRRNGRGFHHHEAKAAQGEFAIMDSVIVGGVSVCRFILAHGRQGEAVAQGHASQ